MIPFGNMAAGQIAVAQKHMQALPCVCTWHMFGDQHIQCADSEIKRSEADMGQKPHNVSLLSMMLLAAAQAGQLAMSHVPRH